MKEENEGEYEGRMIRDDAEEERRDAIKTINGMIEEIGPLSISQSLRKDWSVLF